MFCVQINFPPTSSSISSLFKKTYRSLRHASIELNVSYYFLYNCYHKQHKNQFTRFFNIYRVDENNNKLKYKLPKKKNKKRKNTNDLKHLVRNKPIKTGKKSKKTKTKNQVKKKESAQDEWVTRNEGIC